jgi:hypothetical protein
MVAIIINSLTKGAKMKSVAKAKERKKEAIMMERTGYEGICPSCENLPLCSFIHSSRVPVTFCEEFAISGTTKIEKAEEKQVNKAEKEAHSERFKGLCATCDNANDCGFPKDEAGVWHCEEYR